MGLPDGFPMPPGFGDGGSSGDPTGSMGSNGNGANGTGLDADAAGLALAHEDAKKRFDEEDQNQQKALQQQELARQQRRSNPFAAGFGGNWWG